MQAITISIGQQGINYFAAQLVNSTALRDLDGMHPPNKDIDVGGFSRGNRTYERIWVYLRHGRFLGLKFDSEPVQQKAVGTPTGNHFDLRFPTQNPFEASYNWKETYRWMLTTGWPSWHDGEGEFSYNPKFSSLLVDVMMSFHFIDGANGGYYELRTNQTDNTVVTSDDGIPSESILNRQTQQCFETQVSEATAKMIAELDLGEQIQNIFQENFKTIPASGNLTDNIRYDFGLGTSGMQFPMNELSQGIQVGVSGRVQYKSEWYDAEAQPELPLPPVPLNDDTHHINIYVSNFEVNGLYWAYFKDGGLDITITADQLNNPSFLKTETYELAIPALGEYGNRTMNAVVKTLTAPVNHFQTIYLFDGHAMDALKEALPDDLFLDVDPLRGNVYISKEKLREVLKKQGFDDERIKEITAIVEQKGLVVTQDMEFTLVIQVNEDPKPQVGFTMKRINVLTDLHLGQTDTAIAAQTVKFRLRNVSNEVTYDPDRTTVPNFTTDSWGQWIWPLVGEPAYAELLNKMGEKGVPIPIMRNFKFVFDDAVLRVEDGYISILANVEQRPIPGKHGNS